MSEESIARRIAERWGLAGSTNLVQAGLLIVLVLLLLGIAGGWWVGGRLAKGQAAQEQLTAHKEATAAAVRQLGNYQQAMASAAAERQALMGDFNTVREQWRQDREQDRIQQDRISAQLEAALAARPDLADVRVGADILRAWNDANRGHATGGAGTDPAAGTGARRVPPAVPGAAADGPRRQGADPAAQPRRGGGPDVP